MNSNDRLLESFQTALMRRQQRVKDQNDRGDQDEANDLNSMNHIMGLTTQMGEGQAQRDMLVQQHADTMARELARDRAREAHEKNIVNMQGQKQQDLANHWTQQSKDAQQLQDDKQLHEVEQAKAKQLMAEKMAKEKYAAEMARQRAANAAMLERAGVPKNVRMIYETTGEMGGLNSKALLKIRANEEAQIAHATAQIGTARTSKSQGNAEDVGPLNETIADNQARVAASMKTLQKVDDLLGVNKEKTTDKTATVKPVTPVTPAPRGDAQAHPGQHYVIGRGWVND